MASTASALTMIIVASVASRRVSRRVVSGLLRLVYWYPRWHLVCAALRLAAIAARLARRVAVDFAALRSFSADGVAREAPDR